MARSSEYLEPIYFHFLAVYDGRVEDKDFTPEWLDQAGLKWTESDFTEERQGFVVGANSISSYALLDPDAINVLTLQILNGERSEAFRRGYLHALRVLSEAWKDGADV